MSGETNVSTSVRYADVPPEPPRRGPQAQVRAPVWHDCTIPRSQTNFSSQGCPLISYLTCLYYVNHLIIARPHPCATMTCSARPHRSPSAFSRCPLDLAGPAGDPRHWRWRLRTSSWPCNSQQCLVSWRCGLWHRWAE